jgi:hypothetical protein
MRTNDSLFSISNGIIDGADSKTNSELYFISTGDNYLSSNGRTEMDTMYINASGNFYSNLSPQGKNLSDILDGGDSGSDSKFIAPVIGGVYPTNAKGI